MAERIPSWRTDGESTAARPKSIFKARPALSLSLSRSLARRLCRPLAWYEQARRRCRSRPRRARTEPIFRHTRGRVDLPALGYFGLFFSTPTSRIAQLSSSSPREERRGWLQLLSRTARRDDRVRSGRAPKSTERANSRLSARIYLRRAFRDEHRAYRRTVGKGEERKK